MTAFLPATEWPVILLPTAFSVTVEMEQTTAAQQLRLAAYNGDAAQLKRLLDEYGGASGDLVNATDERKNAWLSL